MAKHKDEWEMAEAEAIKVARTAIRLKHTVMADRELNERLPEIQEQVRAALANGRQWEFDIEALFGDTPDKPIVRVLT